MTRLSLSIVISRVVSVLRSAEMMGAADCWLVLKHKGHVGNPGWAGGTGDAGVPGDFEGGGLGGFEDRG
jgi:hypothetical protein